MASVRAENVAEVVWELKRVDKYATYTEVATRAGFKPGVAGKTLQTVLANVQRDWPHLQWWRTIPEVTTRWGTIPEIAPWWWTIGKITPG